MSKSKTTKQAENKGMEHQPFVSSSTAIEPISCELSESMKAHIEMLECTKNAFDKYATKVLMMPKEMFGSK